MGHNRYLQPSEALFSNGRGSRRLQAHVASIHAQPLAGCKDKLGNGRPGAGTGGAATGRTPRLTRWNGILYFDAIQTAPKALLASSADTPNKPSGEPSRQRMLCKAMWHMLNKRGEHPEPVERAVVSLQGFPLLASLNGLILASMMGP